MLLSLLVAQLTSVIHDLNTGLHLVGAHENLVDRSEVNFLTAFLLTGRTFLSLERLLMFGPS